MEKPLLIIMAKWPAYGRCKSRLAKDIGRKNALSIQKKMLMHTISVSRFLEKKKFIELSIATTGIGSIRSHKWSKELGIKHFNLQGKGTLGERMRRQILKNKRSRFKNKCQDYLIIGTDLPNLCHLDLLEAISKVKVNDIIFGPSKDGGYWLIGISNKLASTNLFLPFIDITWSSDDVLQKTLDNLINQKLKVDFLNCKVDIDTIKDLEESS